MPRNSGTSGKIRSPALLLWTSARWQPWSCHGGRMGRRELQIAVCRPLEFRTLSNYAVKNRVMPGSFHLFAKKAKSINIDGDVYVAEVESFTHKTTNNVIVSKKYLSPDSQYHELHPASKHIHPNFRWHE